MQHNLRKKNLFYLIYLLLVLLPCLEIALLILGYRPYRQVDFKIESTPENCLIAHPSLGFALHPGTFRVTINEGLIYRATHGADSLRYYRCHYGHELIYPVAPPLWIACKWIDQ